MILLVAGGTLLIRTEVRVWLKRHHRKLIDATYLHEPSQVHRLMGRCCQAPSRAQGGEPL
jgi:hypothetical protein